MSIEAEVTKRADERVNHYIGLSARIAFAVVSIGCLLVAGWFVFEGLALGAPYWFRNAVLVVLPVALGMAAFTALQIRWGAFSPLVERRRS